MRIQGPPGEDPTLGEHLEGVVDEALSRYELQPQAAQALARLASRWRGSLCELVASANDSVAGGDRRLLVACEASHTAQQYMAKSVRPCPSRHDSQGAHDVLEQGSLLPRDLPHPRQGLATARGPVPPREGAPAREHARA